MAGIDVDVQVGADEVDFMEGERQTRDRYIVYSAHPLTLLRALRRSDGRVEIESHQEEGERIWR